MTSLLKDFESVEWDQLLCRWISGLATLEEREQWESMLTNSPEVREKFCDWLKQYRVSLTTMVPDGTTKNS